MRKNILLLLTALAALFITSCTNPGLTPGEVPGTNDTGTVRFSWSDGEAGSRSRANNILDADKVVITIEAADGTVVYDRKQLNLYNFNGSFISEPLALKVGNYRLTEYLILNSAGTVIFATPKAGSAQAHLVTMPLPHDFTVTKDGTTKVKPQVVDAATVTPAEFGYTGFTFEEAKIFNFNVSVMIYDATADGFVLTDAALDVTTDSKSYSFSLANVTNSLAINDVAGSYNLTLKKAGYENHVVSYTNAEMKAFLQTPLTVVLSKKVDNRITFVDPNLETMVRRAISKPTGDIYPADVANLTTLNAERNRITNISGIERLTSLITLSLNSNTISDISPLSTLTKLVNLNIGGNAIKEIDALLPLTNLENLFLSTNAITDISTLSALTKLKYLYISQNNLSSIAPLSGLVNLTTINMHRTGISDISPLSGLTNLTTLYLNYNRITDLTPLSALTKLTYLNLGNNTGVTDITPLLPLTKLTELSLSYIKVTDFTTITALTGLKTLYLNSCGLSDISPLSALTNITALVLNDNTVTDITALSSLNQLVTINLNNNSITDLSPLLNNPGMGTGRYLYVSLNPLSADATGVQIPALEARGVYVSF